MMFAFVSLFKCCILYYFHLVQVQLDKQIIQEFLMEAVIMKKFNHPNVLKIFGVSVYEDKPCIILPLMSNGDLKKYLIANKSVSTKYILCFLFQGDLHFIYLCIGFVELVKSTFDCIFFGSGKGYGSSSREKLCSLRLGS